MNISDTLGTLAELLGSGQGLLGMLILTVLTLAAPIADRYLIRRKRLSYRVQYDSKLGLSFDGDDIVNNLREDADAQVRELARGLVTTLDRMTIVVIRIRNTGVEDITADDTKNDPIVFSFGDRVIWNARISEPSIEEHRGSHERSLVFLPKTAQVKDTEPADSAGGQAPSTALEEVRKKSGKRFLERLLRWWQTGAVVPESAPEPAQEPRNKEWTAIRLRNFELQAQEKFKLVVVLQEPETDDGPRLDADGNIVLTKAVVQQGRLSKGKPIRDEKETTGATWWPRVVATIGVALVGVMLATLLANASRPAADSAIDCGDGELAIVGSSAFTPALADIADEYASACGGASVETQSTGSKAGVRMLGGDDVEPGSMVALSDGAAREAGDDLTARPLAVIVYALVVNESVGVNELTAEQVRGIYSGRYTNWRQLRQGPSLPIRIIGRGGESGSRTTFERTVLRASEGPLSSDSCDRIDRSGIVSAPTIRCERGSEEEVLDEVTGTDGAIGYMDMPTANTARVRGAKATIVELDGGYPDVDNVRDGYPFWTIEYLYTKGQVDDDSLQTGFIDYLRTGTARDELHSAGYTPCVGKDGLLYPLCGS